MSDRTWQRHIQPDIAATRGVESSRSSRGMAFASVAVRMCNRLVMALLLLCGACAATTATARTTTGPSIVVTPQMGHPHVGDVAPDFDLSTASGERVRLSSLLGHPTYLAFVTSWCPFSRAEQPAVQRIARDTSGRAQVVVVSLDETESGFRQVAGRYGSGAQILWDPRAAGAIGLLPAGALPRIRRERWKALVASSLVIDRSRRIRFFTVLDTARFDAELRHVQSALEDTIAAP